MEAAWTGSGRHFGDACKARGKRGNGCISGFRDRDLLQIASDKIKIRIPKTKGARTEVEDYYAADVEAKYGVTPAGFIELKALMGDTADNIPACPRSVKRRLPSC